MGAFCAAGAVVVGVVVAVWRAVAVAAAATSAQRFSDGADVGSEG